MVQAPRTVRVAALFKQDSPKTNSAPLLHRIFFLSGQSKVVRPQHCQACISCALSLDLHVDQSAKGQCSSWLLMKLLIQSLNQITLERLKYYCAITQVLRRAHGAGPRCAAYGRCGELAGRVPGAGPALHRGRAASHRRAPGGEYWAHARISLSFCL